MTKIGLVLRTACTVMWCLPSGCTVPDDQNWDRVEHRIAGIAPESLDAIEREEHWNKFNDWFKQELRSYLDRRGDVPKKGATPEQRLKAVEKRTADEVDFNSKTFLSITCKEDGNEKVFDFPIGDFLICMGRQLPILNSTLMRRRTFDECISEHIDLAERSVSLDWGNPAAPTLFDVDGNPIGTDQRCKPQIAREFQTVLDKGLSDKYTAEDLTRILVSSKMPPPWAQIIGITVIGGVVIVALPELAIALCALGADYACPPSANTLPGQTPQPAPTGGDR